MEQTCNQKNEISRKGAISNGIAWVFIVLQSLIIIGGLYADRDTLGLLRIIGQSVRSVHKVLLVLAQFKPEAMAYLISFILAINLLGIGALVLSSIVWFKYKNKNGKITMIFATVVITVNSLLSIDSIISYP